jgi:hypothetical protein
LATPRDSSKRLCAAVRRLTGESPRKVTHGVLFRVKVMSSDGHPVAVTVQVDTHRKTPSAAAMNDLADRLRIPRGDIDEALANWGPDELRKHLCMQTKVDLLSRAPAEPR